MDDYLANIKKLVKEKKTYDKIITSDVFCIVCGHNNPLDIEYHHIGGKANSSLVIPLCRNCHGRVSRKQDLWPDGWSKKPKSINKCLAMLLRGISDILRLVSDYLWNMDDES